MNYYMMAVKDYSEIASVAKYSKLENGIKQWVIRLEFLR